MKIKIVVSLFIFVLVWGLGSLFVSPAVLPSPVAVIASLGILMLDSEFYLHVGATLTRTISAFLVAAVIGVSLGIFLGYHVKIYGYLSFFVDFFRSLPAPALIPLFMVFFGVGDITKIVSAVFVVSLIILIHSLSGVKTVKTTRRSLFRIYNATK